MNTEPNIPGMDDPRIPPRAVSVYGQADAMDDFPVLKAFQQYIDAEQAKARKRMTMLAIFFGVFTLVVIAVFVTLLVASSDRNQKLNDRILEYVMQERAKPAAPAAAPVVVQSPAQQDNSAILAMTGKLEEMRKQLAETEARTKQAEKAAREAAEKAAKKAAQEAAEAAKPKSPSSEELEILRLKALLSKEREAAAVEKEKRRQAELEAYRRKHYPECYAPKKPVQPVVVAPARPIKESSPSADAKKNPQPQTATATKNASLQLSEINDILNIVSKPTAEKQPTTKSVDAKPSPVGDAEKAPRQQVEQPSRPRPAAETKKVAEPKYVPQKEVSVTVEGKKASWRIPD